MTSPINARDLELCRATVVLHDALNDALVDSEDPHERFAAEISDAMAAGVDGLALNAAAMAVVEDRDEWDERFDGPDFIVRTRSLLVGTRDTV